MQSSAAAMFRALVMLACLVAIPLAALVGRSLPDLVRGLRDGQWPWRSASAYESGEEAPAFEPADPSVASSGVVPGQTSLAQQQVQPWPLRQSGGEAAPLGMGVVPAGHQAPVGAGSVAAPADWPGGVGSHSGLEGLGPTDSHAASAQGGLSAAGAPHQLPYANPGLYTAGPAFGPGDPAGQAASTDSQFTYIQARLRQLGATYYVLESWGSQELLFRFYCKMAIGGDPNYTRYFEATESDPLRAMAQVLGQVEAWRAARQAEGANPYRSGMP